MSKETIKTKFQGTQERWHFSNIKKDVIEKVASKFDLDPLLAKLLIIRKIADDERYDTKQFLSPSDKLITDTEHVTSPEELKKGLLRLEKVIRSDELLVVNGDPDADGITGTAILVSSLRRLGAKVHYDFPTRSREGHGLQPRIIDEAVQNGAGIILTVDCGSKDIESVEYANSQGIDVIICDHHTLGKKLPNACAFINPFMVKERTLMQSLSGAGIAFKLMLALYEHMGQEMEPEFMNFLLSVACLGTISDRMSILNPMNRVLVKRGVEEINTTKMEGLKALKQISSHPSVLLRPRDIARTIVPRLNAPGRIGDREEGIPDSRIAVDLLLMGMGKRNAKRASRVAEKFMELLNYEKQSKGDNVVDAASEASLVDDVNERRKYITSKIEDEIDHLIEEQVDADNDKIVIVTGKNWNPGVIGIDTDRLKERFLRPAIILTEYEDSDYLRGSCRSIPSINMYRIIDEAGDKFEEKHKRNLYMTEVNTKTGKRLVSAFGGHAQACGFSLHKDDVEEFKALIREIVDELPMKLFNYYYEILETIEFQELNLNTIKKLNHMIPFGQEFEYPMFYLKGCRISKARPFGNKYQNARTPHVDFLINDYKESEKGKNAPRFKAVGFGLWEKLNKLRTDQPDLVCDIIFTLDEDHHKGPKNKHNKSLQSKIRLNVQDIRLNRDYNGLS